MDIKFNNVRFFEFGGTRYERLLAEYDNMCVIPRIKEAVSLYANPNNALTDTYVVYEVHHYYENGCDYIDIYVKLDEIELGE